MNVLSRYTFISTYQTEKLTKIEATEVGVDSIDFAQCDTDGDGNITIEEILANTEVCAKILTAINKEAQMAGKVPEVQEETAKENQFALDA